MQRIVFLFALSTTGCHFSIESTSFSTTASEDMAGSAAREDLASSLADLASAPDLIPIPSNCASITTALCDGFESGAPATFWTSHQTHGSLTVDSTRAYRGTYSLRIHDDALSAGVSSDVRLAEMMTFSAGPTDVYVRAFLYLPAAPANAAQLLTALDPMAPYHGVGINLDGGDVAAFDSVTGGYVKSPRVLALGQWTCVQWQIHLAMDTTGYVRVYADGVEIPELHTTGQTETSNGTGTFSAGFSFYQPAAAQDVIDA